MCKKIQSLYLDVINIIVYSYAVMTRSSMIILSLIMSWEACHNMQNLLKVVRKKFQNLFECAAISCLKKSMMYSNSSSWKFTFSFFWVISSTSSQVLLNHHSSVEFLELEEFEFEEDVNKMSDTDDVKAAKHWKKYEKLTQTFTVTDKKTKAFRNFLSWSNVHIDLHYEEVVNEYATLVRDQHKVNQYECHLTRR